MSYNVVITDTAKQDLREISVWIAEQSGNIETAKNFIIELKKSIDKLRIFPNSGSLPKDRILISAGLRFIVHKNYLIFYNIDESAKAVYIMAVFSSDKDYMRVMHGFV